ncbi:TPA: hypothetical protein DCW38_02375 [candidate division WOR-3 bacterium]|jgi:23S rRNA (uracil1939-C5)-methyltransferase|uniref:TRAM domain-containing protein n=1 Tax=candidate division WOR-3 bacterium TaxID=2052148 RepID=A0A350H8Z3_UNCW3|nr:hypothetical protein [candidate division WOR-3 bacterium]
MTENKKIKIEKIISDGRGLGRSERMTYLIEKSVPGEIVAIKEEIKKKSYVECKISSIEEESLNRTIPVCPYYDSCGGCDLQHIKVSAHKEIKTQILKELLKKNAKIEFNDEISYFEKSFFNYRNKITLKIDGDRVGLLQEKSNRLVEIDECLICCADINKILKDLKSKVSPDNRISRAVIKNSAFNKTLIAFYTDYSAEDKLPKFMADINADSIIAVLKDKSAVFLKGNGSLADIIDGKSFAYSYSTFMQVNLEILQVLVSYMRKNLIRGNSLLDLYSGVGLYSIIFHDLFKDVVSVEGNKSSIHFQRKNLKDNKISNVNAVSKFIDDKLFIEKNAFDTCIIDPPREGVPPLALKHIFNSVKDTVIYISCDGATLSRDLKLISGSAFKIKNIAVFDMFPNTIHFETVVILERE